MFKFKSKVAVAAVRTVKMRAALRIVNGKIQLHVLQLDETRSPLQTWYETVSFKFLTFLMSII
jgi:hypothetical protein